MKPPCLTAQPTSRNCAVDMFASALGTLGRNSSALPSSSPADIMEPPTRHRECICEDWEGSCLMRPILPWRDGLISWDSDDYNFGDQGSPSMTSGSSQPSTSRITPEAETKWSNTQGPDIDPSIALIASEGDTLWGIAEAPGRRLYSSSDDLFPEYYTESEKCFNRISRCSQFHLHRTEHTSFPKNADIRVSEHFHPCCDEDGDNISDDQSEWSEEDDSLETIVFRALPGDRPLAAHLIPILYRDYHVGSQASITQKVVPWREDIASDGKNIHSPKASSTSENHSEKRRRNTGSDRGEDEDEDGGGDDEDNRKRKRMKGISETDRAEPNARLACPFHKKDPAKYNIQFDDAGEESVDKTKKTEFRACAGPGFKNIQRLKEHLKRKHYPVQCDRCYTIFPGSRATSITELESHRQLPTPCERKESSLKEGISDAQWAQLDKKTSSKDSVGTSNVEKWNHIWSVLFPDTQVPSTPWYDNPSRELTLPNEEARPFLDLFRQMLDYQVAQQDIQFPEDSEEIMKARVVELVGKAIAVYSALDGSTSINSTSTRSLQRTSTSGGSMQPIFSVTSDRTQRRSTMSSTSAPSSVVSMDSPEMIEGMNYSPTIFNVTSNPLGGSHGILVASPLPSSDLDDIVPPRDQGAPNRLDGVVHRVTADDSQTPGEDEGAA